MKKFHKRAAVFLTAATLAGLPAGAFFYSSPGSLTVWADNVEVESSEESSPFRTYFSLPPFQSSPVRTAPPADRPLFPR